MSIPVAARRCPECTAEIAPAVALFLGVGLLGERLTIGAVAGLILIAVGARLATRRQATPSTDADSCTGPSPGDTAMQSRPARGHPAQYPDR
jgi:hypothetical protein